MFNVVTALNVVLMKDQPINIEIDGAVCVCVYARVFVCGSMKLTSRHQIVRPNRSESILVCAVNFPQASFQLL